ncbi:polysaccharide deacetylase [Caldalkalibacillus thermarum TA2.A1]|uniref:Polysaccharide deacetylase n=1 Tax=Caldalkalibacillus thermarum (strain TA2.A1) TaxID=986075 RepID=F5L7C3_CALTT|nr:polysaccharide deacetylase family protein [Caldalkalibacillus thermarum]EGL82784.1 polysaccharide deacetylase [Caldalkalibacillus thermarum TA2.A1]QZT33927.1 polysaccharide deacetylase family protein [Caldalkalibacillus thermarum TA2.A1]
MSLPHSRVQHWRRLSSVLLLLVLLMVSLSAPALAEESRLPEAPIYVDGQPIKTKYIMRDGHLMVPALFLKATGTRVDWNSQYRSVVFRLGKTLFALPVGKKYTDDYVPETGKWKRDTLSTASMETKDGIFVPLLDVVKKLGMEVTYNPQLKRTYIRTGTTRLPALIYSGNTKEKLVALTFDDGPDGHYTPQILDILKEKGVPATFFVMGRQVEYFPEMMKRIVNEGHALGNHTMTHPDLRGVMTSNVIGEVRATQQVIEKTVGRRPDLFRPPYGALTRSDRLILHEMGFRVVMWSVDTLDWRGMSAEDILSIVHRDISPGGIILQHNLLTTPGLLDGTVEALPQIIDQLHAKGYKFVTVQTLLDHSR